jgi:hypothetical protein
LTTGSGFNITRHLSRLVTFEWELDDNTVTHPIIRVLQNQDPNWPDGNSAGIADAHKSKLWECFLRIEDAFRMPQSRHLEIAGSVMTDATLSSPNRSTIVRRVIDIPGFGDTERHHWEFRCITSSDDLEAARNLIVFVNPCCMRLWATMDNSRIKHATCGEGISRTGWSKMELRNSYLLCRQWWDNSSNRSF